MGRNTVIGLLVVLLLALVAVCLAMRAPAIEDDLARKAQNVMATSGFGTVKVSAEGRDLIALAPTALESESRPIEEALRAIKGVRTVDLQFVATPPESVAEPDPAPDVDPVPAPESAPTLPAPAELQDRLAALIARQTIEFESGSDRLTPASLALLNEAARLIADRDDVIIEVAGHTDNTGNVEANLRLSRDRAQAVVEHLVTKNVSRAILESRGYGASRPVDSNDTDAGRLRNRRVEFVITPK